MRRGSPEALVVLNKTGGVVTGVRVAAAAGAAPAAAMNERRENG